MLWRVQRLLNKDRTGDGGRADSGLYDIRRALVVEVPRVVEIATTGNTTLLDQPDTGLLDPTTTTTAGLSDQSTTTGLLDLTTTNTTTALLDQPHATTTTGLLTRSPTTI